MSLGRWWSVALALLLAFFMVSEAEAQRRTGGSFGGGSFGRSSGSRSSGSRSSGSRTSSGSRWGSGSRSRSFRSRSGRNRSGRSWGGSNTGGYNDGSRGSYGAGSSGGAGGAGCVVTGICCFIGFVGLVILILVARRKKGAGVGIQPTGPPAYNGPDAMHVDKLSIGIDWRARREVQDTLKRLAETGDTESPQGLANLLRETVLALRRAEMSWLYIGESTVGPVSPQDAEQQFNSLEMGARAAFQTELVRATGGQVHTQDAGAQSAHKHEGEGTVVVHLLLATYRAVQRVQMDNPNANQIRAALDDRAALGADALGVLRVVWSPAADDDRMSTAELEQYFPDLRLIDPTSIAGRIFCSYCRGPFAMELLTCPHCGAPAEGSRGNTDPRGGSGGAPPPSGGGGGAPPPSGGGGGFGPPTGGGSPPGGGGGFGPPSGGGSPPGGGGGFGSPPGGGGGFGPPPGGGAPPAGGGGGGGWGG